MLTAGIWKKRKRQVNKEFKLIINILLQSPTSNDFDVNKISCSSDNKPRPKKRGKKAGTGRGLKFQVDMGKCYPEENMVP